MKRFILGFIITILFLAFAIGQCNNTTEYGEIELDPFYPTNAEQEEMDETDGKCIAPVPEKNIEKKCDEVGESIMDDIVLLPQNIPSQLLSRTAYSLSYNVETLCPNWVAWHLTAEHTDGPYKRLGNFHEEEKVPVPRATLQDYKGSGWSRGHMCPAGDNKWDENAMYESFSLVNVCPQNASLNSGVWNRIEMDCRKWANRFGDVYIVCGPILMNREHETIGVNEVVVPEAFYKVVLCLQGTPKAIGFVVKNNEGTKKKDQYVNTVDDVERITGYDFFSALPDSIEKEIEAYANLDDWR